MFERSVLFDNLDGTYVPFPDPKSHRIKLDALADEEIRQRLRQVWTDPLTLDPSRRSARVTREIAAKLAELAKSLEKGRRHADDVAHFLMRCLFTMFAEDIELLPRDPRQQGPHRRTAGNPGLPGQGPPIGGRPLRSGLTVTRTRAVDLAP